MDRVISLREHFPHCRYYAPSESDWTVSRVVFDPLECRVGDWLALGEGCEDPAAAACAGLARGARGILTSQLLPLPLPQCIVADVEGVAAKLLDLLEGSPGESLFIIGVVGGDGKTTTSLLTAGLLRSEGYRTAYDTDLGCSDGVLQQVAEHRQIELQSIARFLSDARDAQCAAVVLELSRDFLLSSAAASLPIDLLVILGDTAAVDDATSGSRSPDHDSLLDRALGQLRSGGVAVVSADSRAAIAAADRAAVPMLTFSMQRDADITAKIFDQQPGETTLMVTAGDVTAVMETSLTGPAMAPCHLAALTVGTLMEIPLHRCAEHLRAIRKIPGRMQRVAGDGGPQIVLDRAGNSKRLAAVLRGIRRECGSGKLWLVAAVTGAFPDTELARCGRIAEKFADHTVVTSAAGGKQGFLAAAHEWLDGVRHPALPRLVADREVALRWVLEHASADDTVIIAGGWPTDWPLLERAGLDGELELVAELQNERNANSQQSSAPPVLLPHPALHPWS